MAKAYSAPQPAKDLHLDHPFQKVVRAWREVASPSEAAVGDFLQQHEPPTIAQRQDQPHGQRQAQPGRPSAVLGLLVKVYVSAARRPLIVGRSWDYEAAKTCLAQLSERHICTVTTRYHRPTKGPKSTRLLSPGGSGKV